MVLEFNATSDTWKEQTEPNVVRTTQRCWNPKYRKALIAVIILAVVILISLLIFFFYNPKDIIDTKPDIKTLKFASILFRHGARTPTGSYNSDPYKNYNWPDGWGMLTNLGKQQMYNLGRTFRKKYYGFLPDDYSDDDIYILSSDKDRTLMSAYSLLAGLYPPTPKQTWNSQIPWQPIPVHTIPRQYDALVGAKRPCPVYDKYFNNITNSAEVQKINDKYKDLFKELAIYSNETITMLRVEFIYSHLEIQHANGLVLPEWTKGIFPERIKDIPGESLALYSFDDKMQRFKGGPLLSQILNNMKKKLAGELEPDRKMFLYSGHDLTIVTLWRTLTFKENLLPQFGAALVLELHEIPNTTESEVKLFYYNSSSTITPHQLKMPLCNTTCTITQFEKLVENHIPLDWEKECGL